MVHSNRLRHVQMSNPLGLLDSLDRLGAPCPVANWSNLDNFGQFGQFGQTPQINSTAARCTGTRVRR